MSTDRRVIIARSRMLFCCTWMLRSFSRSKVKVMTRPINLQWQRHTFQWCGIEAHLFVMFLLCIFTALLWVWLLVTVQLLASKALPSSTWSCISTEMLCGYMLSGYYHWCVSVHSPVFRTFCFCVYQLHVISNRIIMGWPPTSNRGNVGEFERGQGKWGRIRGKVTEPFSWLRYNDSTYLTNDDFAPVRMQQNVSVCNMIFHEYSCHTYRACINISVWNDVFVFVLAMLGSQTGNLVTTGCQPLRSWSPFYILFNFHNSPAEMNENT